MVKITGAARHRRQLSALNSPGAIDAIGRAIYAASDYIRVEAQKSIAKGAIQGKGHLPSLPGEAPNWDTGQLATNIINRKTGRLKAEVSSQAPYSLALEVGTSKMAARPFMGPAGRKGKPQAERLVNQAVKSIIRSA